jgi:hypothetical protein
MGKFQRIGINENFQSFGKEKVKHQEKPEKKTLRIKDTHRQ